MHLNVFLGFYDFGSLMSCLRKTPKCNINLDYYDNNLLITNTKTILFKHIFLHF